MLWMCLYLPDLPLEIHTRGVEIEGPFAICVKDGGRDYISLCNEHAAEHGVCVGQRLGIAQALCSGLRVKPRDDEAEWGATQNVAIWLSQFSSFISLEGSQTLFLEVGGSVTLFGGVQALTQQIQDGLEALGYTARWAVAPFPRAAALLARAGQCQWLADSTAVKAAVGDVSIDCLELPADIRKGLQGLGLKRVSECFSLPSAGLAKRFGKESVMYFDRLRGYTSEPLRPYLPPLRFASCIELPAATDQTEALLFVAKRLIVELVGYLRGRGAGAQRLLWMLSHEKNTSTRFQIGLVAPSREESHFVELLRTRLERVQLTQAVYALGLIVEEVVPLAASDQSLWGKTQPQEAWALLVERLSSRMGDESLHGLINADDHRPERAWRSAKLGAPPSKDMLLANKQRPLWLLDSPQALSVSNNWPHKNGKLEILSGPERIESGWWDEESVDRDYYIAKNETGERFWIYRERRDARMWFLHGLFS